MDPSSLIFVVIVAMWATYLLGHWVRRRDHLATIRSVDRFSEAMRVLERRPAVRAVPLSRPNPRSYVVAPTTRPAPEVTVKRAAPVVREVPVPVPVRATAHPTSAAQPTSARPTSARPTSARPTSAHPSGAATARRSPVPGLLLLGLLVATPVVWVLVPLTALSSTVGLVMTAALAATLGWLRHTARRRRDLARRQERLARRTQSQARRQSRRDVVGQVVASRAAGQPEPDVVPATDDAEPVVDPGWQPVPVPPPTYTLKAKAPARRPVPAEAGVEPARGLEPEPQTESAPAAALAAAPAAAPTPAPAVAVAGAGGFDLDEILQRRIAANQ